MNIKSYTKDWHKTIEYSTCLWKLKINEIVDEGSLVKYSKDKLNLYLKQRLTRDMTQKSSGCEELKERK